MARPKKESTREMISFRLPLDLWSWVMSRSDRTEMLERLVRDEMDKENAKRFPELWKLWQEEHPEDIDPNKDPEPKGEGRWTGTGIGDAGGWEGLSPPPGWTRDPND